MAEASIETADKAETSQSQINPEVLQNITVTLSIEVGRAMIKIRDLMRLTVVAQGEIVLVNDRYGVRLTRVAPASERIKNL